LGKWLGWGIALSPWGHAQDIMHVSIENAFFCLPAPNNDVETIACGLKGLECLGPACIILTHRIVRP